PRARSAGTRRPQRAGRSLRFFLPSTCRSSTGGPGGWPHHTEPAERTRALSELVRRDAGMPDQQSLLRQRNDYVEQQRERGEHQDPREHAVDVEGALRLQDEVPHASRGSEVLADHRAYERHADRGVQAGEDPTRRRGKIDVAQELPPRGAQHADAREHDRAHLAHSLEDVEEDDEEDQRDPQRYFGGDAQPEPDRED